MGMMELFCQKKCAGGKARQHCSFGRSQKGTEHARYEKRSIEKLYRHNDIPLVEHYLTFFKYNFLNNIFFIYIPYKYE